MRRGGSVWIGVSAQFIGIEGTPDALLPLHLKAVNLARYGSLVHSGDSFCFLFGTTGLFSGEEMASLYTDEAGFVQAVRDKAEEAVAADFLLQEDAEAIITWAPQQWRSQTELIESEGE